MAETRFNLIHILRQLKHQLFLGKRASVRGFKFLSHHIRRGHLATKGIRTAKICKVHWTARMHGPDTSIGMYSRINHGCSVDAYVTIGINTGLAPRVIISTSTHDIGDHQGRAGTYKIQPVTIGNGVWIGTGAIILPGVTVGDGAVIAAGAVVNKDCEPDGLYAGVPARRIKDLA